MNRLQHCIALGAVALFGITPSLQAATPIHRHAIFVPNTTHPHTAVARFSTDQTSSGSDPVLLLLFGIGLCGCASLCVVQSHREEKRRAVQHQPGQFVRLESA